MDKSKERLVEIIETNADLFLKQENGKYFINSNVLAQAILSAGYIHRDEVEVNEDQIGFLIYKTWGNFSEKTAREDWTGKHIQPLAKKKSSEFAHALATNKSWLKVKES